LDKLDMETVVLSLHIVLAVCLVVLVLLQQGKGADMGAFMGSGGANSLFGVSGASNILVKMTTSVAVAFMLTSVLLVRFAAGRSGAVAPEQDPLKGSGLAAVAAVATATPVAGVPTVAAAEAQASEAKKAEPTSSPELPSGTPAVAQ